MRIWELPGSLGYTISLSNLIGYFVCDYNNVVLFPRIRPAAPGGATAEETHHWLWDHRPSSTN